MFLRYITRTGRETAEDATLIFGGRGITQTGMGKLVENVSLPCESVSCYNSEAPFGSTTEHRRMMPSLEVPKMSSGTLGCAKPSRSYRRTSAFDRGGKTISLEHCYERYTTSARTIRRCYIISFGF